MSLIDTSFTSFLQVLEFSDEPAKIEAVAKQLEILNESEQLWTTDDDEKKMANLCWTIGQEALRRLQAATSNGQHAQLVPVLLPLIRFLFRHGFIEYAKPYPDKDVFARFLESSDLAIEHQGVCCGAVFEGDFCMSCRLPSSARGRALGLLMQRLRAYFADKSHKTIADTVFYMAPAKLAYKTVYDENNPPITKILIITNTVTSRPYWLEFKATFAEDLDMIALQIHAADGDARNIADASHHVLLQNFHAHPLYVHALATAEKLTQLLESTRTNVTMVCALPFRYRGGRSTVVVDELTRLPKPVLVVGVIQKGAIPPTDLLLPKTFHGLLVDVISVFPSECSLSTGGSLSCSSDANGQDDVGSGTITCVVESLADPSEKSVLTNCHVVAPFSIDKGHLIAWNDEERTYEAVQQSTLGRSFKTPGRNREDEDNDQPLVLDGREKDAPVTQLEQVRMSGEGKACAEYGNVHVESEGNGSSAWIGFDAALVAIPSNTTIARPRRCPISLILKRQLAHVRDKMKELEFLATPPSLWHFKTAPPELLENVSVHHNPVPFSEITKYCGRVVVSMGSISGLTCGELVSATCHVGIAQRLSSIDCSCTSLWDFKVRHLRRNQLVIYSAQDWPLIRLGDSGALISTVLKEKLDDALAIPIGVAHSVDRNYPNLAFASPIAPIFDHWKVRMCQ